MDGIKFGLGSLFVAIAAVPRRYVYHRDHAGEQWNVFERVDGKEQYSCSFYELDDAQSFCDINNGVLESIGGK